MIILGASLSVDVAMVNPYVCQKVFTIIAHGQMENGIKRKGWFLIDKTNLCCLDATFIIKHMKLECHHLCSEWSRHFHLHFQIQMDNSSFLEQLLCLFLQMSR